MSDSQDSTEGTELRRVEVTDVELDAISGLVGAAHMEVPHPKVVRIIAEGTEIFLRRRLKQLARPKATHIELPSSEDAENELVIPLLGSQEEQEQLIQRIVFLMLPGGEDMEGIGASTQIAEEALKLTLEYGILPEKAEGLMRAALAESKRPDADAFLTKYECGHEVVWLGAVQELCPHPDSEGGICGEERTIYSEIMVGGWLEAALVLGYQLGARK